MKTIQKVKGQGNDHEENQQWVQGYHLYFGFLD